MYKNKVKVLYFTMNFTRPFLLLFYTFLEQDRDSFISSRFTKLKLRVHTKALIFKKLVLPACTLVFLSPCLAQSNTVSAGGEATGSSGSISYSIGQVNYINVSSGSGKISEGVQQPIEILTINIEELPKTFSASIFPNPASDQLIIQINSEKNQALHSMLYDVHGNLLLSDVIQGNQHSISLSGLSPGIYILKIRNEKESITSKIIKSE